MTDWRAWSDGMRLAAALVLLALAAVLLIPAAAAAPPTSWEKLIAPLGVGRPVARGYVLSPPRRGEAHDVIYVARRQGAAGPLGRIEVHILNRGQWPGVAETRSFGVGWEVPPPGSLIPSPPDDADAVTHALVEAIARNDTGFASVDVIPLTSERGPPPIARVLARLAGMRGALVGAAVAVALVGLASIQRGPIVVGLLLFAIGLALRAPSLDVPFAHDQDVQRMLTGHLPLYEIATAGGLKDRHPPLYFFILHFVQHFGQSEAVARAPAVLAGALIGPALLLAAASMCGRIGAGAVLAALAVTVSPELVRRSREVSETPLFALVILAAAASLVAALRAPRRGWLVTIALAHALAFFTYYLAPFIAAAHAAVLVWVRRVDRRVVIAFVIGVVAGAPAFILGLVTLVRDWGARDVARAFPALAWGEHGSLQMAMQMGHVALAAFGLPFAALVFVAAALGVAQRSVAVLTPALGAAATYAGIALLSPIARVQDAYITTVLPLAALTVAVMPEPIRPGYRTAWLAALLLAIAGATVPSLSRAGVLYMPDPDAFMPRFAGVIAGRPEPTVVTVAHYDATLLRYYLARLDERPLDWDSRGGPQGKRLESLAMVHSLDQQSEASAARRLEALVTEGPTLVVERDTFLLPSLVARLSACEQLAAAPTARLVRCTAADPSVLRHP